MNELMWLTMLIINFSLVMIAFKIWGKIGLFIWIPISVIVANIQVTKTVNLFGLEATLGNIVYASSFLATDILSEGFSSKDSKKAVNIGFFALISMTLLMQLALFFEPSYADFANPALTTIFSLMPRLALGSLVAYFASNYLDIYLFETIKKKSGERKLWLRNCASTATSQLVDSLIFSFIAFFGVYSSSVWWQILLTTYLFKFIVALFDTPFMYLAKHWIKTNKIKA